MTSHQALAKALLISLDKTAEDQQADLLSDIWDALGPIAKWGSKQAEAFGRFIDAGAYEDAALIMVPNRMSHSRYNIIGQLPSVRLWNDDGQDVLFTGATTALAIARGCLALWLDDTSE